MAGFNPILGGRIYPIRDSKGRFRTIRASVTERQRRAFSRHGDAMRQFKSELGRYKKAIEQWRRDSKGDFGEPKQPQEPNLERYIVQDTTVEALALLLATNPRGLLLANDELNLWLKSFDKYSSGKGGSDTSHWLSMFNAAGFTVDRKTGDPRTISIPRAAVSICGGIQPNVLHASLGQHHRDSGLAARLLLTYPPRRAKKWTESELDPVVKESVNRLVNRLFDLEAVIGPDREVGPAFVELTPDAKAAFIRFYDCHNAEQTDLDGDLAAAWSKLEEYPARLALVIHFARWAADDNELDDPDYVDLASMSAAIRLVEWFKYEDQRVYALLGRRAEEQDERRLILFIKRQGGKVTPRQAKMNYRPFRTVKTDEVEMALQSLVNCGKGRWETVVPGPRGGRSTRVFRAMWECRRQRNRTTHRRWRQFC